MARISLFQSVALAVLAAVGTMAVPAQAQDPDRLEAGAAVREARQQARAERQQAAQQSSEAPQAAAPQQQEQGPATGGWQGRAAARQEQRAARQQQREASDGGWRSQRNGEGQRYGRNRDDAGMGDLAAPAESDVISQAPEQGIAHDSSRNGDARSRRDWATQRNRTYSDPNRNGGYVDQNPAGTAQNHAGTARTWGNRQGGHNGSHRDGYREGRSGDNYRDWHAQNHDRNRYASGSRDHRRWDRNNWRRDTRYNWSGYRNQHRDLYRAGRYYSPYNNYRYNRLSIGIFLDRGFYGNRYWINDPYQYRLPEVHGPYRWVRYYDDVLLVDIYSGEVVDVIHNFFW